MHPAPPAIAPPPSARRRACVLAAGALAGGLGGLARAQEDDASGLAGPNMPYAAFDRQPFERVEVPGGMLRVVIAGTPIDLPRERILAFVRQSARSVAAYFGRFPAPDTRVLILGAEASPGRRVRGGQAFGYRGAAIKVVLARNVGEDDFARDWVLVHEMSHLALPSLPRRQHWMEEGMATYVEPLARAQAGVLGAAPVWAGMLEGLPRGLPQADDRGLDNTPTWGRTYWGGALFCLLADVMLRERSANAKGLQHALRAIMAHGNMETDSALEPLLRIGDAAVGLPVLSELHAAMGASPYPVDLDALWRRLGVRATGDSVQFDDSAPLAALRRALTAPFAG